MEQGFGVDTAALGGYGTTASGLAGEVAEVGSGTLSGVDSLAADSFSKLGEEVGLAAAFQRAARQQLDGASGAAKALDALATAVRDTATDYAEQETRNSAALNDAYRV
ncbi:MULTISPECIES: hypothetical protein [Actinosynnema]|uniref:ESX-1 secretion-associated protein n=1 Tax=Actinosynnema pretiosum TaxID=42197 RepID=A0A290ZE63_9PSEU|nr:hypothetical protein [Actinosynnema pretiosum]ATE57285.1 hypothetical protein CNX65_31600 [Actinosynnema pretiosum]